MKKRRLSLIITCIGCLLILLIAVCGDTPDDDSDDNNTDDDDYDNEISYYDNMIVDLKPLVDNPGLGNEDPVHLEDGLERQSDIVTVQDNPLSDVSRNVYIPALKARGVIVKL